MVIFKNLLEDSYDDFAYGVVLKDKRLFCLCGCNSTFEEGDYAIIKNDANPAKDTFLKVKSHKERHDERFLQKLERFYLETACMRETALEYGYTESSMSVVKRSTAKQLFEYGVVVYKLFSDDTEARVENVADFDNKDVLYGVEKSFVSSGDKTKLFDFVDKYWQETEDEEPLKKYVICMDANYVRDAQMIDTKEMTQEEFENIDWLSCEIEHDWHDMAPTPFIGIIEAQNEDEAIEKAAEQYRYDSRCLYGIEITNNDLNPKEFYTLTVMATSDGEFDVSTCVFDNYETAKKEFDETIEFQKNHTWMSNYRIETLDEEDDEIDEDRVVECINSLNNASGKELIWEAYREGYCSSMHTIIKLEKQIITKEAQNAK